MAGLSGHGSGSPGCWVLPAVGLAAGGAGAGAWGPVACSPLDKMNSKAMYPVVQPGMGPTWLTTSAIITMTGIFVLLLVDLRKIRGLYFLAISISYVGTALVLAGQICVHL